MLGLQAELGGQLRLRHHGDGLLAQLLRVKLHQLHVKGRIWPVRLVDDLLEPVVGDDVESIDCHHAGAFAVGQAQAAAKTR